MKVGLIRHFKVKQAYPNKWFVHYNELVKWFEHYESADVECTEVDLRGIRWHVCYSSAMPRALKTAERIFGGHIIILDELKELEFLPLVDRKLKLPLFLWAMFIRHQSLSSNQLTNEFALRIRAFVGRLLSNNNKNVLICCHGFVMTYLQKELIRRGFEGDKFKTPANGRIYIFVK